MTLYSKTFNSPMRTRLVYDKMMKKYDDFFEKEEQGYFIKKLIPALNSHDLVIAADFGHGVSSVDSWDACRTSAHRLSAFFGDSNCSSVS